MPRAYISDAAIGEWYIELAHWVILVLDVAPKEKA